MAKDVANENFEYLKQNFDSIYARYKNKYLVLKDCSILGFYGTFAEALSETLKTEKIGTFSIQHCVKEEVEGYNFYNNNVFFGVNCV